MPLEDLVQVEDPMEEQGAREEGDLGGEEVGTGLREEEQEDGGREGGAGVHDDADAVSVGVEDDEGKAAEGTRDDLQDVEGRLLVWDGERVGNGGRGEWTESGNVVYPPSVYLRERWQGGGGEKVGEGEEGREEGEGRLLRRGSGRGRGAVRRGEVEEVLEWWRGREAVEKGWGGMYVCSVGGEMCLPGVREESGDGRAEAHVYGTPL